MRTLVAATLLLFAVGASAHDAWFEAVMTKTATGAVAELRMRIGEPFTAEESMPFETPRVSELWIVSHDVVRDLRADPLAMAGMITLPASAPAMIDVERIPFDVSLDGEHFNTYLEDEGHYELTQSRIARGEYAAPARERVTRHIKAFLGAPSSDREAFLHVFGTKLEIVPAAIPVAGQSLPMKITFDGKPLRNARVTMFGRGADGKRWQKMVRTDKDGAASLVIPWPGFVMIRTTRLQHSDRSDTDYQSDWAALTFVVE